MEWTVRRGIWAGSALLILLAAVSAAGGSVGCPYYYACCIEYLVPPPGSMLPSGVTGSSYSTLIVAEPHTNCNGHYLSFSLSSGTLPPGLTLHTPYLEPWNLYIQGTPTVPGTYDFEIVASAEYGLLFGDYTIRVDGPVDFVAGRGAGYPNDNRVRILDQAGMATPVDFLAYQAGAWGTYVGLGTMVGWYTETILTGPGPGAVLGPQARGFDAAGDAIAGINFYAYGTLRHGVHAEGVDVTGDGSAEIVTGPGSGEVFGPHVRGFEFSGAAVGALSSLNFFAYNTLRYGAEVEGGDLDQDRFDEVLTGPGPGPPFGAVVRSWNHDGVVVRPGGITFAAFAQPGYGANVVAAEVDGDSALELIVGNGPGPSSAFRAHARGFEVASGPVAPLPGFDVYTFGNSYGARVGGGDIGGSGRDDLVAGPGPDPSAPARVRVYDYDQSQLTPRNMFVLAYPGAYGVDVTTGFLDW